MLSMMDRLWRPDLTEAQALELMHRGIEEVRAERTGRSAAVYLHGCWQRCWVARALVDAFLASCSWCCCGVRKVVRSACISLHLCSWQPKTLSKENNIVFGRSTVGAHSRLVCNASRHAQRPRSSDGRAA